MATTQNIPNNNQNLTSAQAATEPGNRVTSEQLIDRRIGQTRMRVKSIDLMFGLLLLAVATLGYLSIGILCDQWLFVGGFGTLGRVLGLLGLLAIWGVIITRNIVPCLIYRVNPLYAAQTIEQNAPSMKNALLNVLFLRKERESRPVSQLEQKVYQGLARDAATGARDVSIESVVDRKPLIVLGYVLVGLVMFLCLYTVFSPKNPLISAGRIMMPWTRIENPTRVTIRDIRPGDVTAFHGDTITVSAEVDGTRRNEPVLLYFTTDDRRSVDQTIPMSIPEGDYRYECQLPTGKLGLQRSLSYRIGAGDRRSEPYRVEVKPAPSIVVESIRYDYPEYSGLTDQTVTNTGDIRALEGTEVTLRAKSNVPIDYAMLDWDCNERLGVLMTEIDEQTAAIRFTLSMSEESPDRPWHESYQLRFADTDGRTMQQPIRHLIDVIDDMPPEVAMTSTPEDGAVIPLDGSAAIQVRAEDPDFALAEVAIRMQVIRIEQEGVSLTIPPVLDRVHQGPFESTFTFEPGRFAAEPTLLQPGDQIEYWAEAADNKTPDANRTATEHRWLTIGPPENPQQQPQQQPQEANNQQDQPSDEQNPQQGDTEQQNEQENQNAQQGKQPEDQQNADNQSSGESGENSQQQDGQQQDGQQQDGQQQDGQQQDGQQQDGQQQDGQQQDGQQQDGQQQDGQQQDGQQQDGQQQNGQQQDGQQQDGQQQDGQQQDGQQQDGQQQDGQQQDGQQQDGQQQDGQQQDGQQQDGQQQDGQQQNGQQQNGQQQNGQQQDGSQSGNGQGERSQDGEQSASNNGGRESDEPIDGQTNPGEAFDEVLNHMREKGQDPDQAAGRDETDQQGENQASKPDESNADRAGEQGGSGQKPGEPSDQQSGKPNDNRSGEKPDENRTSPGDSPQGVDPDKQPDGGQADPDKDPNAYRATDEDPANAKPNDKPVENVTGNTDNAEPADEGEQAQGETQTPSDRNTGEPDQANSDREPGSKSGSDEPKSGDSSDAQRSQQSSGTDQPQQQQPTGEPGDASSENQSSTQTNDSSQQGEQGDTSPDGSQAADDRGQGSNPEGGNEPQEDQQLGPLGEDDPNLEYAKKATNLALDYLENQLEKGEPDAELLDRLGWTRDELERFVKQWQRMRDQAGTPDADLLPGDDFEEAVKSLGLRPRGTRLGPGNQSFDSVRSIETQRYEPPPGWKQRFQDYTRGAASGR